MADWRDQFAGSLLNRLGIRDSHGARKAIVGWIQAEGGHTNGARFNPLNTTQAMPGAGNTGSQGNIKVYSDWTQGVEATARTLKNGRYGGILHGLSTGDAGAVARAIGSSPWGTSGDLVARTIGAAPSPSSSFLPQSTRPSSSQTPTPPPSIEQPTFDQGGYDEAVKHQRLATFLSRGQTGGSGVLFKSGLLSTRPVNATAFQGTTTVPGAPAGSGSLPTTSPISGGGSASSVAGAAAAVARKYGTPVENAGSNRGGALDKLEGSFGMVGQAWCGILVGAMLKQMGYHDVGSWIASVAEIERVARNHGGPFRGGFSTGGASARPGDLVIPRRGAHVAMVERVDDQGIHVIGGNNSRGTMGRAVYDPRSVYGVAKVGR